MWLSIVVRLTSKCNKTFFVANLIYVPNFKVYFPISDFLNKKTFWGGFFKIVKNALGNFAGKLKI